MVFEETPIPGSFRVSLEKRGDDRGFFARLFCKEEFRGVGLDFSVVQANNSRSEFLHTLRGMHYQLGEWAETKLVRCIHGTIFDVVLDLRPDSSTFGRSFGIELSEENREMLLIPKGCAHGFLTLTQTSEVIYLVDQVYSPNWERGIRWDDSRFNIDWPAQPVVLSERDASHPNFDREWHLGS